MKTERQHQVILNGTLSAPEFEYRLNYLLNKLPEKDSASIQTLDGMLILSYDKVIDPPAPMTTAQAIKKFGKDVEDCTFSVNCPRCGSRQWWQGNSKVFDTECHSCQRQFSTGD